MNEQNQTEVLQHMENRIAQLEQDAQRLTRAHGIACYNITELNDQKNMIGAALNAATLLLNEALTEMRLANVTPSAKMIYSKANFDQAMKKLISYDPQRAEAYRDDLYRNAPTEETQT